MVLDPPAGYRRLALPAAGFRDASGPFFAKRSGDALFIGLRIEARHANAAGIADGGMILALADVILTVGPNIQARLSRFLTTLNTTCEFIGAASIGAWIEGRVEVLKVTRSHVFARTLVADEAGAPVANASGVLLMRGEPDPRFAAERYLPPESGVTQ